MLGAHRGERELSRTPVGDGAARMACDPQGEVLALASFAIAGGAIWSAASHVCVMPAVAQIKPTNFARDCAGDQGLRLPTAIRQR